MGIRRFQRTNGEELPEAGILTILDQGGMLDLEDVSLFGKTDLAVKAAPGPAGEAIPSCFCHNYFEQDTWETGGYDQPRAASLPTKVGWRQFNLVCSAVYVLVASFIRLPSALPARTPRSTTPGRSSAGSTTCFKAAMTTAGPEIPGASTSCCQTTGGMMTTLTRLADGFAHGPHGDAYLSDRHPQSR